MPTMVLRFPGGRYHATPGGHHVNEGLVEWPPSPWRIVRALIACGYSTQQWTQVPPAGQRLIEALSSVLPEYRLPPAVLGHSRHYMPIGERTDGKTTLVLDAFADVGDGSLWVRWPTTLDEEERRLFDSLAAHLGYLGRSEAWVLAESVSDDVPLPEAGRAFPHGDGERPGRDFEQLAMAAPWSPEDYQQWRLVEVGRALDAIGLPRGKKVTSTQHKKIAQVEDLYPADLLDCLQRDTAWWKARKWSQAPGSRSVLYWRAAGALDVGPPASTRGRSPDRVEMMLLALTTPSGSMSALPALARTLPQADLMHKSLVSKVGFGGEPCPELVGRDDDGGPLRGHAHAFVLPIDLDGDARLDHVIIYAAMGLGACAQRAVRSLRKTYTKGGVGELQVAIAGVGALNDLRALRGTLGDGITKLLGPVDGATSWITATPFVPPRYLKKRGRSSLVGQVEAELAVRGYPSVDVEVLGWTGETLALRHFVRRRARGPQPPVDAGFTLRLNFERPVTGPICLGYGCHFGLGRFAAETT